jgi:hypothetical protein
MRETRLLRLAIWAMVVPLVLMLIACVSPSPHTLALFLGPGLGAAAIGLVAFALYVVRDLRGRGAL